MRIKRYTHSLHRPSSSSGFANLLDSEINWIWKVDWRTSLTADCAFTNQLLLLKMSNNSFSLAEVQFLRVISQLCISSCSPKPILPWFSFWPWFTCSHSLTLEISVLWYTVLYCLKKNNYLPADFHCWIRCSCTFYMELKNCMSWRWCDAFIRLSRRAWEQ